MKFRKATNDEATGTHQTGILHTDYHKIVSVFGEPEESNSDKIQVEWILKFEDRTIATVYDYRAIRIPEKNKDWYIGGKNKKSVYYVLALVLKHYRALIKDVFEANLK
jgi:hypothetical protein